METVENATSFTILNEADFVGSHRGKPTALYTLKNKNGLVAQITNFGAKIASLYVPDKNGNFADIVQGYETIDEWIKGNPYFGAICGRYANRIAKGKFTIDGVEYSLPINNGPNALHGGPNGFNDQVFDAGEVKIEDGRQSVKMVYKSADGEEGYPGNLTFTVVYTLTDEDEFILDYYATTDKATHIGIATHSFFNLEGHDGGVINDHDLMINAKQFTPIDDVQIPTGEFRDVAGTEFDFTETTKVGKGIDDDTDQIKWGAGYDHNWVIDKPLGELGLACVYSEPKSGRVMEIYTTQPGLQFYSVNWHDGSDVGKGGCAYQKRSSICLEPQNYPDSPNKPQFPSTLLKPGEEYKHTCVHKFLTK